ncbi:MAG: nicotinate-nicotinamide nucleotide adenylyltransferase, partial [Bacteroidaceae bacterium]
LPRPSFMVHTLEALRKAYPNHQFILIIGADNWLTFNHWFQPEEIRRHHHIIVYPRKGYDINQAQLPHGVSLVNTPLFPISSTDIRRKLKRKEAVRTWLNPKVEAYIKEKGFF